MDSIKDINLLILSIEKSNIIYKTHKIPEDVISIDQLYLKSIENNWIKPKEMFYFINDGNLLDGEKRIENIPSDIILLSCSYLTKYKLSSVINSNNSLMQDISDIITRPPSSNMSSITSYLNTNIATLSSESTDPVLSEAPFTPYESQTEISSAITSSLAANMLANAGNSQTNNITSGSQLMNEFTNTINNMLNSVNVVIDPNTTNLEVPNISPTDLNMSQSLPNLETLGLNTSDISNNIDSNTSNNTDSNTSNNIDSNTDINSEDQLSENIDNNSNQVNISNDTADNQSNDILPNPESTSIDHDEGTNINEEGTNINSVNNTIAQLLNIYQSSSNSDTLSSIREQYNQQFEEMHSMGFTDETKIITALYVCEGNCENAINYYLSLQDDL